MGPDLTHGTVDGAQGHEALHVVGEGAAVGVPVGVLSLLQDELLALEVMVLKAHPAAQHRGKRLESQTRGVDDLKSD